MEQVFEPNKFSTETLETTLLQMDTNAFHNRINNSSNFYEKMRRFVWIFSFQDLEEKKPLLMGLSCWYPSVKMQKPDDIHSPYELNVEIEEKKIQK